MSNFNASICSKFKVSLKKVVQNATGEAMRLESEKNREKNFLQFILFNSLKLAGIHFKRTFGLESILLSPKASF